MADTYNVYLYQTINASHDKGVYAPWSLVKAYSFGSLGEATVQYQKSKIEILQQYQKDYPDVPGEPAYIPVQDANTLDHNTNQFSYSETDDKLNSTYTNRSKITKVLIRNLVSDVFYSVSEVVTQLEWLSDGDINGLNNIVLASNNSIGLVNTTLSLRLPKLTNEDTTVPLLHLPKTLMDQVFTVIVQQVKAVDDDSNVANLWDRQKENRYNVSSTMNLGSIDPMFIKPKEQDIDQNPDPQDLYSGYKSRY